MKRVRIGVLLLVVLVGCTRKECVPPDVEISAAQLDAILDCAVKDFEAAEVGRFGDFFCYDKALGIDGVMVERAVRDSLSLISNLEVGFRWKESRYTLIYASKLGEAQDLLDDQDCAWSLEENWALVLKE